MPASRPAPRIAFLFFALLAATATAVQNVDDPILADDFESDRLFAWTDAVGLAEGQICYRPETFDPPSPEWSGTCAPDLLCCALSGTFPSESACLAVAECPIVP